MKLALVSDALDPTTGWGRYAGELASELIKLGVDVRLISPRARATISELRDYPDHHVIPSFQHGSRHPLRVFFRTTPPLIRALRGADVIHCMIEPFAPAVAVAAGLRPYFVSLVGTYGLPSGRPRIDAELRQLILCVARENARWGSIRIVAELRALGFSVSARTVRRYRDQVRRMLLTFGVPGVSRD